MKFKFILFFAITIIVTSCSKNISIYKKHFSSGYNINFDKRYSDVQHALTKKGVLRNESEIINQYTSSRKVNEFKKINEVRSFIHSKKINNLTLKKASSIGIKKVLKSEEKVLTLKNNIHGVIIEKGEINQKKPYNGCMIDLSSSFWYALRGLLSFIFTVLVIIFVISIFKSLATILVLIYPIILFIGMVALLALALFVILPSN
jgi:hypothetical protein